MRPGRSYRWAAQRSAEYLAYSDLEGSSGERVVEYSCDCRESNVVCTSWLTCRTGRPPHNVQPTVVINESLIRL